MLVWGGLGLLLTPESLWGLPVNTTFSLVITVLAAIVVVGGFLGRHRAHYVNEVAGTVLLLLGLAGLAVASTTYNVFDLNLSHCVALFVTGSLLITAGMYTKAGSKQQERAEEIYRHNSFGRVAEVAKVVSAPTTD
jgi:hypothetical protein